MAFNREQRLKRLLKEQSRQRKEQQQKMDILCKDMVAAHCDYSSQIQRLVFSVEFYESVMGKNELMSVLGIAGRFIKRAIENANVAIYLNSEEDFAVHLRDNEASSVMAVKQVESCFSHELAKSISRSSKVFGFKELRDLAMQENLSLLENLAVAAVPLKRFGPAIGFMLIYRGGERGFSKNQLEMVSSIVPGLCKAIDGATVATC